MEKDELMEAFEQITTRVAQMEYQMVSLLSNPYLEGVWKGQITKLMEASHDILFVLEGLGFSCTEIMKEYPMPEQIELPKKILWQAYKAVFGTAS